MFLLINKKLNQIYIRLPKNNSTFIGNILLKNNYQYIYITPKTSNYICHYYKQFKNNNNCFQKQYKHFIFIRNPYKRFISGYFYTIQNINNNFININELIKNKNKIDFFSFVHIFLQQSHFFNYDKYIIKQLNIYKDDIIDNVDIMLNDMNINLDTVKKKEIEKNKSIYEKPFYEYYDQDILDEVNKLFADDFENFGYKKFSKLDDFINFFKP
jgi:hypothetical protein